MTLEAREISFGYKGGKGKRAKMVLEDLSLRAESHERTGIVAPSGFGKTTFCKLLSGYEKPDRGEVLLDGRPLDSYGSYCPVQMIWQHPEQAVNPRLRLREVLREGDGIEARVIEGLGIEEDWLSRFPAELSGGELQRFCIARALGERTRFLLADEISTMLDLITQSLIWSFLIEEVERRQIGLLAVSHSMPLLKNVCTKIYDLENHEHGPAATHGHAHDPDSHSHGSDAHSHGSDGSAHSHDGHEHLHHHGHLHAHDGVTHAHEHEHIHSHDL